MRVWVARRRLAGVSMRPQFSFDGSDEMPLELIVRNLTDPGQFRPSKVARLYSSGDPVMVSELLKPRLYWMRKSGFVLAGVERRRDEFHQAVGFSQSWLCQLAPPFDSYSLRVMDLRESGVVVSPGRLGDRTYRGQKGEMQLGFENVPVPVLGRYSKVSRFIAAGGKISDRLLLDVELEWMGEDCFELSGVERRSAHGDRPEALFDGGWLCRYWVPDVMQSSRKRPSIYSEV
jgi:hypothetical protein